MLKSHQAQVSILVEAIKSKSREDVDIKETRVFQRQLFSLKHSGPTFQKLFKDKDFEKITTESWPYLDISVDI